MSDDILNDLVVPELRYLRVRVDAINDKLSDLNCAVHSERLCKVEAVVEEHDKALDTVKGFRAQVIGGAAVVWLVLQFAWTKVSRYL